VDAGLEFAADALRIRIDAIGTFSSSGPGTRHKVFTASAVCYYAIRESISSDKVYRPFGITVVSREDTNETTITANYWDDLSTIDEVIDVQSGFVSSAEIALIVSDFRLYRHSTGGLWVKSGPIDVQYNGGSIGTLDAWDHSAVAIDSDVYGWEGVPFVAIGPVLSVGGEYLLSGNVATDVVTTSISITGTGGIDFQDIGSVIWTAFPATLPPIIEPPAGVGPPAAPYGLSGLSGLVGASDSANLTVSMSEEFEGTMDGGGNWNPSTTETSSGSACVVANNKGLLHMVDPGLYASQIAPREFGPYRAFHDRRWQLGTFSVTGAPIVHPVESLGGAILTSGSKASVIDDLLQRDSYCGVRLGKSKLVTSALGATTQEQIAYYFPFDNIGTVALLHEEVGLYEQDYVDARWRRHYRNVTMAIKGKVRTWLHYWKLLHQQWMQLGGLNKRTNLIGEPASDGWEVGLSRWEKFDIAPVASVAVDSTSSARWSATGATLGHGGSITVTPTSTTCTVRFLMLSWDDAPFMYPAIAGSVDVGWTLAAESPEVFLVPAYGTRESIGSTAPGILQLVRKNQAEYAGSWGINNVPGETALDPDPDTGTDSIGDGHSADVMGSATLTTDFGFLTVRSGKWLEFEFTGCTIGVPFTLEYPEFYKSPGVIKVINESPFVSALLWTNGCGIRLGQFRDGTSDAATPTGNHGSRMNARGLIYFYNEIFRGVERSTDFATFAAQMFDSFEGQSEANLATNTEVYLVDTGGDPAAIVSNGWRESMVRHRWPQRKWDENLDKLPGQFGIDFLSHVVEPRFLICPRSLHIFDTDGVQRSEAHDSHGAWAINKYSVPVDNQEEPDWPVKAGADEIAEVTPWHGYFAAYPVPTSGGDLHLTRHLQTGFLFALVTGSGELTMNRMIVGGGVESFDLGVADAESAQTAVTPDGQLVVVYGDGSGVKRASSFDFGETWSSFEMVASGTEPAVAICEKTGIEIIVAWDDPSFVCYRSTDGGETFTAVGTVVTADESRGGLEFSPDGARTLVFVVGEVRRFESRDFGESWTEV